MKILEQNNTQPENSLNLKKVYTVQEIAEMLELLERTAYHFCANTTDFKVIKVGPRLIRIDKKSFDEWFNS